jgi:erythritol kinase (D-erythritol 1-phosphate-forming)
MTADFIVGVDVGTSVIKSVIFDMAGRERWTASAKSEVLTPAPGWAEQDMEAVWQTVKRTVAQVMAQSQLTGTDIAAVGITGQGDGTWLIGHDGQPARRAIIWLDGRSGEMITRWLAEGLSRRIFAITGTGPNTANQSGQLCWLATHEPETLARCQAAVHAKDWIFFRMTGRVSSDESDVSHTFFDVRRRSYSDQVIDLFGLGQWRHLLPPTDTAYGNKALLLRSAADELGLAASTPVVAGPFDVAAAALGVGALDAGDACSIIGTAGIHQMVLDRPVTDPADIGYTLCYAPRDRWLRLLPTMTGTLSLDWFIEHFCQADVLDARQQGQDIHGWLEERVRTIPVGSAGVIYHPFISPGGERAPFVKPTARAQFFGLSMNHTRYHLLRAVYEGVALAMRNCYAHMPAEVSAVRLAGGGSRSAFWVQMLADVMGKTMRLFEGVEFGARGAAMNAAVAVGLFADYRQAVAAMVRPADEYLPDPERTARYAEIYRVFEHLYRAMWDAWDEMAAIAQSP